MKITWYSRLFPPTGNAGAEWMALEILHALRGYGHEPEVACMTTREPYEFEGISVYPSHQRGQRAADLVITHLEGLPLGKAAARALDVPLVHVAHNPYQAGYAADLVIANSQAVLGHVTCSRSEAMVVHPPVNPERYSRMPVPALHESAVLLLNLMREKGSEIFYELARRLPGRAFLGVQGAWGHQQIRNGLANVTLMPNLPSIRGPLAAARVVLMPSWSESYGRVAVEAACAGRVAITSATEGLQEAMGDSGVYCDLHDPDDWEQALMCLDDADHYDCHATAQHARAITLWEQSRREIMSLEERIRCLV